MACFYPQVAPQHCATAWQLEREVRTEELVATKVTLRFTAGTERFKICPQRAESTLFLFRDPKEEIKVGTWTLQGMVRTLKTFDPRHCEWEGCDQSGPRGCIDFSYLGEIAERHGM